MRSRALTRLGTSMCTICRLEHQRPTSHEVGMQCVDGVWGAPTSHEVGMTKLDFRFVVKGELDQRVRAVKVEFLADVGAVIFDCSIAHKQFGGDFLARF